ncbi:MAG: alpha/beta fold hydrolase [Hyphomicrobiaceae bacterium]|nr:alpha/beta fold hydrolase [Hyphomicrobiaceae bacterium]
MLDAVGTDPDWAREGPLWPNREASRFVAAAGLDWHVQEMGAGPALLLLHGTAATTHSWAGLMPLLARHFRVIAPDLPGHGFTSAPPAARLSLDGMAGDVATLLDRLGIAPEVVIGHSAGAAILVRQALDGRVRPRSIIALNGALLPFGGIGGVLFPALARLLFVNPLAASIVAWRARDRATVERLIVGTGSRIDATGLDIYARLFTSKRHAGAALAMMANWDLDRLKRELPRLAVPLELVVASGDIAIPPQCAFDVARLAPKARVTYLRGLGHLAHEEDAEQVARVVLTLAGVDGAG